MIGTMSYDCLPRTMGHLFGSILFFLLFNVIGDRFLLYNLPNAFRPDFDSFKGRIVLYSTCAMGFLVTMFLTQEDRASRERTNMYAAAFIVNVLVCFLLLIALCISCFRMTKRDRDVDTVHFKKYSAAARSVKEFTAIIHAEMNNETSMLDERTLHPQLPKKYEELMVSFENSLMKKNGKLVFILIVLFLASLLDTVVILFNYATFCGSETGNFLPDILTIFLLVVDIALLKDFYTTWLAVSRVLAILGEIPFMITRFSKEHKKNRVSDASMSSYSSDEDIDDDESVRYGESDNVEPLLLEANNSNEVDFPPKAINSTKKLAFDVVHEEVGVSMKDMLEGDSDEEKDNDVDKKSSTEDSKILAEDLAEDHLFDQRRKTLRKMVSQAKSKNWSDEKTKLIIQSPYYQEHKHQFVEDLLQDSRFLVHYFFRMEENEPGKLIPTYKANDVRALAGIMACLVTNELLNGWNNGTTWEVSVVVLRMASKIVRHMVSAARWTQGTKEASVRELILCVHQLSIPVILQDCFNISSDPDNLHKRSIFKVYKYIISTWNLKRRKKCENTVTFLQRMATMIDFNPMTGKILFADDVKFRDNTDFSVPVIEQARSEFESYITSKRVHRCNTGITHMDHQNKDSSPVGTFHHHHNHKHHVSNEKAKSVDVLDTIMLDKKFQASLCSLFRETIHIDRHLHKTFLDYQRSSFGVALSPVAENGTNVSDVEVATGTRKPVEISRKPVRGLEKSVTSRMSIRIVNRMESTLRVVMEGDKVNELEALENSVNETDENTDSSLGKLQHQASVKHDSFKQKSQELALWRNHLLHYIHVVITGQIVYSIFLGVSSNLFFRMALHVGEPTEDYQKFPTLLFFLAVFIPTLLVWYRVTMNPFAATIAPIIAIVVGGVRAGVLLGPDLDSETFLGLPPQYDLQDKVQNHLIPILYGVMHVCLFCFAVLPLTMSRWILQIILPIATSAFDPTFIGHLFRVHEMYHVHRMLGYGLVAGLLLGATVWWIALYHSCSEFNSKSCIAFHPEGSYVDIRGPPFFCKKETIDNKEDTEFRSQFPYDGCWYNEDGNPGSVLFLREVVVSALILMLLTAGLKYPVFPIESETVSKTLLGSTFAFLWRINHEVAGFITRNSFELFLYTHALAAYAIAIGAFFSRFEVFYPAIIFWGLFVLDKIVTKTFYIHDFECKREHKGRNYDDALRLVLTKSGDKNMLLKTWKPQAGQIIFLQCQELGFTIGRQWHAFSLSSISEDGDTVELLIKVHKDGWTDKLKRRLYQSYEERSKDRTSHNSNIVSRLGNEIAFWSSCMFRRGAGERLDTLNFKVMGPFGSSFSDLGDYEFILLIGGGAGIASSLSILKDIKRKMALSPRRVRVWFIWTTRSLDSVLWCWESLKETLADAQGAYSIRVSIHVTQSGGLTRSEQRVVEFADYESPSVLEKDVFLTRTSSTVLGESFDHVSSQVNSSELNSLIAPKQTAQGTDYSTALQITNLSALLSAGGISDEVKRRSNLRSIEVTSADLLPLPARKSVRLKDCLRQGRPDWAKYLVSFSAQAFAGNHIGKTKICACGPKALYASINQAVNMISNRYKMDLEFNSENFE